MAVDSRKISDAIGVEILGIDPTAPIDAETVGEIRRLWLDNNILLFRGVDWMPAQHIAFTRNFGPLHIMPKLAAKHSTNLVDLPEIFVVSNIVKDGKPVGVRRAGWGWHSDGEDKQLPNMGSMLHAVKVPKVGGDTAFANTRMSYEALPKAVREIIEGKRARFSRTEMHAINYPNLPPLTEQEKRDRPDVWHPIARTHPETRRECLYIGRWAVEIEGMPEDEGKDLIAELTAFATRPEFVYTHKWTAGDVTLWDNRSTQHCALPYDDELEERYMLRTTLEGDVPYFECADGTRIASSLAPMH